MRIIDHAEERLLLGRRGQQAQHRQPDQEPIGRVPRLQPEGHAERIPLRARQPIQPIQQRRGQLLQDRERTLHLRLHTNRPHHPEPRRGADRRLDQRRLPDPRIAG
jgi:hypothetical protein